jgi:hypothetical protein
MLEATLARVVGKSSVIGERRSAHPRTGGHTPFSPFFDHGRALNFCAVPLAEDFTLLLRS